MTVAKKIENTITKIPEGQIFSFKDLNLPNEFWDRTRMKLSRMVRKGILYKAAKGKYYKPTTSIFGVIPPSRNEIVKDLMYKNGQITGYLTYFSIWNEMKLTSQISSTTFIASSIRRNPRKRNFQNIKFIMQPNEITEENKHLLQILDTLKYIQKIPDSSIDDSVAHMIKIIEDRSDIELEEMVRLVLKYPPRTRALFAAILSYTGKKLQAKKIEKSLNPASTYKLGISKDVLPTIKNWKIV